MNEKISYVISSTYRMGVMGVLSSGMNTPTNIANKCNIRVNHISRVLKELTNMGLIECLTPTVKKGRLYNLTDDGLKVVELINKMG